VNSHYQNLHSWHRLGRNSVSAEDGEVAAAVTNEACKVVKRVEESEIEAVDEHVTMKLANGYGLHPRINHVYLLSLEGQCHVR